MISNKTANNLNKNIMKTYSTFLPIFNGFYGNSHFDNDYELEREIDYIHESRRENVMNELENGSIDLDFDYVKYQKDVAKELCDYIQTEFINNSLNIKIEFERVVSPREYNFVNDTVDCQISCDVEKLLEICQENVAKFTKYVSENFTSCSGFHSFHSNDVNDWLDLDYINDNTEYRVGTLLDFIGREIFDMYEPDLSDLNIEVSQYFTNTDYYLNLITYNPETVICEDLTNFKKACYWFRNFSGLSELHFITNDETLEINFVDCKDKLYGTYILNNLLYSPLIDFEYEIIY